MQALFDRIHREGPVRFDVAVEALLYGDGGFFASGAGAGKRADFVTSPEVGPLFGAVVARALDAEWERLGRGRDALCTQGAAGRGYGRDGGLARYVVVGSRREVLPLGGLDPVVAGPLTDAGATSQHAVKRALPHLPPGSTAVVALLSK